jgi:hypothetical protein
MDPRLPRIRKLITEQERIETELQGLMVEALSGNASRKCGEGGHSARTCPKSVEAQ